MEYQPPIGGAADDPYIDANPGIGQEGSAVPAKAIEAPQREIVAVIEAAGLTPDEDDDTQLLQAITDMIGVGAHSVVIEGATFAPGVTNGKAVNWDNGNARFALAVADGTASNQALGIADVTNTRVYCFGPTPAGLVTGLTGGARYYLDGTTPGALNATAPADVVIMGIAKAANVLFVDIDALQTTADASETVKGKIEIATQGENDTGTDDVRAVTPLKLKTTIEGVARTFSKPQRAARATPAYSASLTLDFGAAQNFVVGDLTGPITLNNPSNVVADQAGVIVLKQDGTGGRALALGTNFKTEDDEPIDIALGADQVTELRYFARSTTEITLTPINNPS